ncbi:acyl-CoA desaturase [Streptomyces sp. H10-C2]|uniref:fatty acid desaturase family protein n=1 Tax=unclassified Streptomyces TaxID=2593676 RepID=UPI0024BB69D4|nr:MULTISPECIES: acyl-CoA desaturase [unclassified Streptomyces]MDJ0343412.1 acyl-CoA desaturase [Streptomyces sp. PH10-H1]MDJ0371777.1 acyl-CoA desaturase [Streptomyces sp. H10-C2]
MAEQTAAPGVQSPARGSDYAELMRQVRRAGLLERRAAYYAVKIGVTAAMLAGGIAAFVTVGDSWWQLATAAYLAAVFTQLGFVAHDAGHQQIFRRRPANALVGLTLGNLFIGISYGWWVTKHNLHHAHPNEIARDPDVAAGAIVFSTEEARVLRGPARILARWQAWLFFPLLTLEGANLHVQSVGALLRRRGRSGLMELGLLALHAGGFLAVVLLVLPPVKALAFVAVQQGLFGLYLGCAFAPNHKGMPMPEDGGTDYLRRQVLTARNIRGGRFTDWVLGGLNYQIEHHLFPSMPRPNLSHVQPLVRDFCVRHGIDYLQCGAVDSYRQALRHLRAVGSATFPTPAPVR